MNYYEFAVARAFAQLQKESETRQLTPKEKGTLRVLKDSVARYRAREAVEAAAQ